MIYQLKARWFVVDNHGALFITQDTLSSDIVIMGPVSFETAYQFIYGA